MEAADDLPPMVIEDRPLADLNPAPYNPRSITPEALSGLDRSISEFGLVEPIVWNRRSGNVVGGHQRLKLLQERGVRHTKVVVVDLDEPRERALNLTLNNDALAGSFTEAANAILAAAKDGIDADLYAALRLDEILFPGKMLEFVPGASLDYHLGDEASQIPELPDSNLHTIRLIMNEAGYEEFKQLLAALAETYRMEDATDIVMEAMRDALERYRAENTPRGPQREPRRG